MMSHMNLLESPPRRSGRRPFSRQSSGPLTEATGVDDEDDDIRLRPVIPDDHWQGSGNKHRPGRQSPSPGRTFASALTPGQRAAALFGLPGDGGSSHNTMASSPFSAAPMAFGASGGASSSDFRTHHWSRSPASSGPPVPKPLARPRLFKRSWTTAPGVVPGDRSDSMMRDGEQASTPPPPGTPDPRRKLARNHTDPLRVGRTRGAGRDSEWMFTSTPAAQLAGTKRPCTTPPSRSPMQFRGSASPTSSAASPSSSSTRGSPSKGGSSSASSTASSAAMHFRNLPRAPGKRPRRHLQPSSSFPSSSSSSGSSSRIGQSPPLIRRRYGPAPTIGLPPPTPMTKRPRRADLESGLLHYPHSPPSARDGPPPTPCPRSEVGYDPMTTPFTSSASRRITFPPAAGINSGPPFTRSLINRSVPLPLALMGGGGDIPIFFPAGGDATATPPSRAAGEDADPMDTLFAEEPRFAQHPHQQQHPNDPLLSSPCGKQAERAHVDRAVESLVVRMEDTLTLG
ncbi:hypothetical protein HDU87_005646 [Geranomyces variabilis]|uniref:Uncharacterized protein n=1 Tax=Geranomyces variabilis TaxID=109894 RepID=A0AAD5THT7_9FUNG|nr:hypothetical protein HDU87_005646 [Geranomyces variabilis]